MWAAQYLQTKCIRLLLAAGAKRDIRNANGKTAVQMTTNDGIVALLESGTRAEPAVITTAKNGDESALGLGSMLLFRCKKFFKFQF